MSSQSATIAISQIYINIPGQGKFHRTKTQHDGQESNRVRLLGD